MKKGKGDSYDQFVDRHIGPNNYDITQMLETIGLNSIEQLINQKGSRDPKSIERIGQT